MNSKVAGYKLIIILYSLEEKEGKKREGRNEEER